MNPQGNIDHARDEDNDAHDNNTTVEETKEPPGGYYYDDTTGYEVFRDEDTEDEEPSPESS